MEYRTLGKTELLVSALGFGASGLGGAFGEIDEAEGIRAVRTALDLGVNYFDCAPYYGQTRAETVLGQALDGIPRESFVLATKVGRYGVDEFDFSAARVTRSIDESLSRLGVERIDIIQCHDIEFVAIDQVVEEALPALSRARDAGKVRFIGITGLPLHIYAQVMERAEVDTVLSYCHYTLFDTSLQGLLPYFEAKGVGVINAAPLSMGLLTQAGPPDWHPASQGIKSACGRAAMHCRERGEDLADLALRFALANLRIHTTVVGAVTPEVVRRNVAAVGNPPDGALLAEVQAILAPVRDATWSSGGAD